MDKTIGNYTRQTDFPLDEETLAALQTNQTLIELLGNIAGDKVILSGCGLYNNNTMRYPGYLFVCTNDFITGEILRFEGGSVSAGMYVKKAAVDVTANNTSYQNAYTIRSMAAGVGEESFTWSEFSLLQSTSDLKTLCTSLQNQINALTPPPLGIVQIWAGSAINIPEGYALCDGRQLTQSSYPELFAVIGSQFNTAKNYNGNAQTTETGMFRLPDLRGRFVVGKNDAANDSDYATIGSTGGEKRHTLSVDELPSHSHNYTGKFKHIGSSGGGEEIIFDKEGGSAGANYPTFSISVNGSGQSHENRPPYYVFAYIMRLS